MTNTFLGYEQELVAEHDPNGRTRFVLELDDGVEFGKVYFGSDVYPGPGVADPNAALSMKAATAHEVSHFHRWRDQTELPLGVYTHLDEALTSLDAALRFPSLSSHDVLQLVRDAVQRLQQHWLELEGGGTQAPAE